jgi:hypothetical protein
VKRELVAAIDRALAQIEDRAEALYDGFDLHLYSALTTGWQSPRGAAGTS